MPNSLSKSKPAPFDRRWTLRMWFAGVISLFAVGVLGFGWLFPRGAQRAHFTEARRECFEGRADGRGYSYCLYRARAGTNGGLVYHFHGRNSDARGWNDGDFYTGQIQAYWQDHAQKPPVVVSVSMGPVWLLMHKTANARSGWLDVFEQQIMQEVEARTGKPRYRMLLGASMGGFNALLSALNGRVRFDRALALCPPLYTLSPWATLSELRGLQARTSADPRLLLGLWWLARDYVQSADDWRELSVFRLLERRDPATTAPLYLSCGLYDPYGNYEGVEAFAKRAAERKLPVTFRPLYGGHCAVDVSSVAELLLTP